ncbi:MAG TPA: SPOR domain-containing protein [Bacteroidales bacterium]|nr:SPOR domain-containing protein [Bacteroidales bacterium]
MKIGTYISELLYEHGQVVLPGFGEFLTKYIPARFIPEEKKIESPKKVADFNSEKTEGGDIFITYASRKEQKPPEVVQKAINDFVSDLKQKLNAGQKVQIDKIGSFSTGPDMNIIFEPNLEINYLADTSGMNAIKEPSPATPPPAPKPVEAIREEVKPPVPKPQKEAIVSESIPPKPFSTPNVGLDPSKSPKTPIRREPTKEVQPPVPGLTRQDLPKPIKLLAWLIVPLGVIIIILALNWRHIFGDVPQPTTPETPAETVMPAPDTQQAHTETPAETVPAVAESITPEPGRMAYYIVVGAFQDEELANRLVNQMREQGANRASIFMRTDQGYHRVAFGFYYSLAEAEAQLAKVQQNLHPGAWILPRRN